MLELNQRLAGQSLTLGLREGLDLGDEGLDFTHIHGAAPVLDGVCLRDSTVRQPHALGRAAAISGAQGAGA